ncbi:MAG: tRNA preQ1(34) S-adenosylmethionine ribosyltransferase-isomerase QueA [Dehalococcoidia bacterium]|nr:tRNA preQ1(34) S-adenosylmethionine ribosyltransferase-isomerase QueA [Dehalococcoidia bacterium]
MKTADFDYVLPPGFIAQTPAEPRDHSRLMVLSRNGSLLEHRRFHDLCGYLRDGDLIVCNDSRVIPARLLGSKAGTGARVEVLLLRRLEPGVWEALARPGRRLKPGSIIEIGESPDLRVEVIEKRANGSFAVELPDEDAIDSAGMVPLPPYIREPLADAGRYQTVFSHIKGSVAAPTAGLHFTPELMDRIRKKGVHFAFITLHLALDSFRPVQAEDPLDHVIHSEAGEITEETADAIMRAKREGRRVVCVGTSSVRMVEHSAKLNGGVVMPFAGWVDLFIVPGHRFHVADVMVTNFHLPRSTLLMLVSAFAGRERILDAYRAAVENGYRFYSFGDAMLIL